ncbi:MAG: hypoxanthine phosphoribosyltransferase [Lentisphaeraceae bacterium]|nr:hypoxanthine phosphoribosyltransferase [Lentisphaeraceae bacterium]
MHTDLEEILFSKEQIEEQVIELAGQITRKFKDKKLTIVCLSNGAIIFAADLIRHIPIPLQFDTIAVSSYRGTKSSGTVQFDKDIKLDITERHVLIVDDILDTGLTMTHVKKQILSKNPASVEVCVLLNKQARRQNDIGAEFFGFDIEDQFVVGYGLDYNEAYRNLACIGILKENIYSQA